MKKLILAFVLALFSTVASAQCNGVFPNNTVCGNVTGASNLPRPTNPASFQGSAGGTNGQIQYNNAGALGGFTLNGDCTIATPAAGTIICLKTNGVAFAPIATVATSPNLSYTASATGASTRTAFARFSDVIHLADYANNGAVCNGAIDDQPTFARAIAASSAVSSGGNTAIILPFGNCTLGSAVTVPDRIAIIGQGKGTNISTTSVNANVFTVTGGNVIIRDMQINTTVLRSGGAYIHLLSGGGLFSNITMAGPYFGVIINAGSTNWTFEDINMSLVVFRGYACSSAGAVIDFGVITRTIVSGVDRTTSDTGYWTDNCGDVQLSESQFLGFIHGMAFDAAAGKDIADNLFSNIVLDNNGQYGLFIRANAAGSSVSRNMFTQLKTTSNTGNGVDIGDTGGAGRIDGVYFTQLMSDNNGNLGVKVDPTGANTTVNLTISGGQIAGNAGSGVSIGANVNGFIITGNVIGSGGSWIGNGGTGVIIAAGTSNRYVVAHNNLFGNTVGPGFSDGGTGTNKIVGTNVCAAAAC